MTQDWLPVSRVTRTKQQARTSYDRLSRWYDALSGGFEGRYRDIGVRLLAPSTGQTMLEIGPGTGHALAALAEQVGPAGRVWGLDLSGGMLSIAQARIARAGLADRVRLAQGDGARLPCAAETFDALFMSFTLELFDTPEIPLVLAECRRTVRPGGRLCVVALSKTGEPTVTTRLYEWLHVRLPQALDCRPILARASVQAAGFHILDAQQLSWFGLRTEVVLAERPV